MTRTGDRPLTIALVAGEASGDNLGAALVNALAARCPAGSRFFGVGGPAMEARGVESLFPMADIAVMGPIAILRQLPRLRRRVLDTVDAIIAARPDALVIIDCPEFSHRVASRVRSRLPDLAVIDYVAPTVWAWRAGRARAMRRYVDEVMAILPFEPAVFERLGGPRCHYVGHPAVERGEADPGAICRVVELSGAHGKSVLAVMPGSRRNEVSRLIGPFGEAVNELARRGQSFAVVVPTFEHLAGEIRAAAADWPVAPVTFTSPELRHAAMSLADAAIVASGTATLELALASTPMVVGYRMERLFAWTRHAFLPVHSIVLANLIHGESPIPELFQAACNGASLADAVAPLLTDTPQRAAQLEALETITARLRDEGLRPSERAAEIVLESVRSGRARQQLRAPSPAM